MVNNVTIESELKRRMDLVNDRSFRIKCSIIARQTGISVEEWNNNKAIILLSMANEYCRLENKINDEFDILISQDNF